MKLFAVTVLVAFLYVYSAESDSLFVRNIPYHRQVTDYCCGEGSMEMVFHHWGADVSQRAMIDINRATENAGTLAVDLVRGGHFSHLSNIPPSTDLPFPDSAPKDKTGWANRPLGYATFIYRTNECWFDKLKQAIASHSAPLIVLMHYSLTDMDAGHYRVLYGYDDNNVVSLQDPWDRNGAKRVVSYTQDVFCTLWNFTEVNYGTVYAPFTAVATLPWEVTSEFYVNNQGNLTVESKITYPNPFQGLINVQDYIATGVRIEITVPSNMRLLTPKVHELSSFLPGQTATVSWEVFEDQPADGTIVYPSAFNVRASGLVKGSAPQVPGWKDGTSYPAYTYVDEIGGENTLWI